jgi:divalent metal cation (Fe/Co/Zn/Cd) transporter
VPDAIASLLVGLLLAVTAFVLAKPLADFLVGRSLPPPLLERLQAIFAEEAAIERVVSLRAVYSGPEEVIVFAKVRPAPSLKIEELTHAMDELDHRIRLALPVVADVFIDVTATQSADTASVRE